MGSVENDTQAVRIVLNKHVYRCTERNCQFNTGVFSDLQTHLVRHELTKQENDQDAIALPKAQQANILYRCQKGDCQFVTCYKPEMKKHTKQHVLEEQETDRLYQNNITKLFRRLDDKTLTAEDLVWFLTADN